MTMWVLVCFSILSTGLYGVVSSRIRLAETIERRIVGEYLAKAACAYFRAKMGDGAAPIKTISELKAVQEQELARGKFKYILKDEESKLNINKASVEILGRLPGFDEELAKKVYDSKLKPFSVEEEILLVDGVTGDMLNKCKELITVYSEGDVNINTAPPEVLKILGFDDYTLDAIREFRAGPDGKDFTVDDGIFTDTGGIKAALGTLSEEQGSRLAQLISGVPSMLSVTSKVFTLEIETSFLEKPAMRYNIVIDTAKDKIRRWQEF